MGAATSASTGTVRCAVRCGACLAANGAADSRSAPVSSHLPRASRPFPADLFLSFVYYSVLLHRLRIVKLHPGCAIYVQPVEIVAAELASQWIVKHAAKRAVCS